MNKILRNNYNIARIFLLIGISFFIFLPSLSSAKSTFNSAEFGIPGPNKSSFQKYPLNFLGTKAEPKNAKISSDKFIKMDPEKNLYVIGKGSSNGVKPGMEFSLVRNKIRMANFHVIKTKNDLSVLKLKRKFPEVKIKRNDLVIAYTNAPTAFLPSYLVNPHKIAIEKLSIGRLFKIAIQNSAEVYEIKTQLDEAWEDYKYAQAKLSPRISAGISWDTEFAYRDIINLSWIIEPHRNEIITKKLLLIQKYKILLEKAKYKAINKVLRKYLKYIKTKERIKLQQKLIKKLRKEKKILSESSSASSIITNRISTDLKQGRIKLDILKEKKKKSLEQIAITLGYPSNLKLEIKQKVFPGIQQIYSTINSLVYIPKGGFETRLAEIGKNISLMDYYIAKEKTYPSLEIVLGFPSLIGGLLPKISLSGKALENSTKFLYQRQKSLLNDLQLKNSYETAIKKIKISFLNRLISNLEQIKELAISSGHSAENIEEISLSRKNYIKALEEKHKLEWKERNFKLDLIKQGIKLTQWSKEIPIKEKIPNLKKAIKKGLQNSYLLKAARRYKNAVHPYLIKAKKRFHKRTGYWEAVLGEREALTKIIGDKLKKKIIKNWLQVVTSYHKSENNNQLVKIAKNKLKIYKNKEDRNMFDILNSKLNLFFTQFNKQKVQLEYITSFLQFKKILGYKVDETINLALKNIPALPKFKKIEKELISKKFFHPEAKTKRKIMQLKKKIEKVKLAQKGWWVGKPLTIRYMEGLPGSKTFEWEEDKFTTAEHPEGLEIDDWLGIQFPISIFDRTPLGEQIHEIRKAKIKMEMQHFKNELYNEKLKMLWDTRHENFKDSKKALKSVKRKVQKAKKEGVKIRKKVNLLKANELDLLSQHKLLLHRKNRYAEYLKNYCDNYIDVLSIGHIYRPEKKKIKEENFVLSQEKQDYPKMKLIEMKSEKIEEAYKQAKKQKIVSWFYARINRIGLGSSITFKPDVAKARAAMRVYQIKYHKRKESFDADRKFAKLNSLLNSSELSQEKLRVVKENLKNLLNYLQKEIEISLSTQQQVNELKDIIDSIELKLTSQLQTYRKKADKIRQLLGLPYYINVTSSKKFSPSSLSRLKLKKTEKLISNTHFTDPKLLLQASQVSLIQKEQKLIRPNRDLSFSVGGEAGIIGESIASAGFNFWLFNPTLKPQKNIFKEREKRFKLKLAKRALNLRKKIYRLKCNNKYYLKYLKKQLKLLQISSKVYKKSLSLYKQHKIRWEGEFGLKNAINNKSKKINNYLLYFKKYQKNYALLREYIREFSKNKDWFSVENLTLSNISQRQKKN